MRKTLAVFALSAALSLPNYQKPAQAAEVVWGLVATMAIVGITVMFASAMGENVLRQEVHGIIAPDAANYLASQGKVTSALLEDYFNEALRVDQEGQYGLFKEAKLSKADRMQLARELLKAF